MKWINRTLQAPAVGRKKPDNALDFAIRCPENYADMVELAAGSEERACDVFFGAYVVKFQNSDEGRKAMKSDGSTDDNVTTAAKVFQVTETERVGGKRGPSLKTVVAKAKAEGKKRLTIEELEAELEAAQNEE